jgi:type I restriction enzyme R subunit
MPSTYTEDHLVEQPAIELIRDDLQWDYLYCYDEWSSGSSSLGRETRRDVVIVSRLRPALVKLNPELPEAALDAAIEELARDRSALSLVEANREVYRLIKSGIKVKVENRRDGGQVVKVVRVVDWNDPTNNDFFLTSQLWVSGDLYTRRPDLVGFVNGLPLVLIEFKKPGVNVREGFDQNVTDYKTAIPQIFHFNALVVISNGTQSKLGSVSATWGHYCEWKKIEAEEEEAELSLEAILKGSCEKSRLLDLTENFTRFSESKGGVGKIVARNHQYLGVNKAVEALQQAEDSRIGVFWHTQGSGKSYSMVFFAEKVFRKIPGNWTFVVITDRTELDTQIYRTFSTCGAATEGHCQATSSENLRNLLSEDHRYVFTLIHKFRTEPGTLHPVLSERDDIIVLTDEAHRSQYDTLAMNMRTALPNAKFVAFTGTPLISGEERTREVFGDYVSIYNFKQSVEDGATVPLFYENRTPELDVTNPNLNDEIYDIIDAAELDEDGERKVEQLLGKRYHLITRDDRLDTVAKDIVHHFINRGHQGKAMVVSIDKATALKMYVKVEAEWIAEKSRLSEDLKRLPPGTPAYEEAYANFQILDETDRALIVSSGQNEITEMQRHGLDIRPHRERMVKEDLETQFKEPETPLGLVFVCAMWLTGFDAPSCSTIYLDKPMRGHTLMQTIARANRVHGEKVSGLIVDYANVFLELEKALAIYAGGRGGELPVKNKKELVEALRIALSQLDHFCQSHEVKLSDVEAQPTKHLRIAVDRLARLDAVKDDYLGQANDIERLYKAIMPDPIIPDLAPRCQVIQELAKALRALKEPVDVTAVIEAIEAKLDDSIVAEPGLASGESASTIDLSKVDFDALEKKFAKSKTKNSEAVKLRALIERKLKNLIRFNASRYDFLERFEKMVEEYNKGSVTIEEFFEHLVKFSSELNEEETRHMREQLSEEELAAFDILTRPGPDLTQKEVDEIKKVCRDLLAKLKTEKLVLNWRNKRTSRAGVRIEIEKMLDAGLPEAYTSELFEQKCGALFQHVLEKYPEPHTNIYQDGVA